MVRCPSIKINNNTRLKYQIYPTSFKENYEYQFGQLGTYITCNYSNTCAVKFMVKTVVISVFERRRQKF